jgi:predicted DNA-binding protein
MPRVRAQLAIQAPPELLERLRAAAAAQRRTIAGLVIEWIEAGLSGALPAAGAAPAAELLQRVAALERTTADLAGTVALLQAHRLEASPERVNPAPRSGERVEPLRVPLGPGQLEIIGANHLRPPAEPEPASPERVTPAPLSGDALTTAEVAERTGTNRAAWNNWAGGAGRVGTVRHHRTAGSWRLIGKAPAPGGGPDRWLWEPVEA